MNCPICNSVMKEEKKEFPVEIGNLKNSTFIYIHICPECGYDENDIRNKKIISETINNTMLLYSQNILQSWKNKKRSFSEIERKFLLPNRTLSKWFNQSIKPSAAAIVLLRIINAFPWIEKVAELGFESEEAKQYIRHYYVSEFNDSSKQISYTSTKDKHIYTAIIKKHKLEKSKLSNYNNNVISNMKYISM